MQHVRVMHIVTAWPEPVIGSIELVWLATVHKLSLSKSLSQLCL